MVRERERWRSEGFITWCWATFWGGGVGLVQIVIRPSGGGGVERGVGEGAKE